VLVIEEVMGKWAKCQEGVYTEWESPRVCGGLLHPPAMTDGALWSLLGQSRSTLTSLVEIKPRMNENRETFYVGKYLF
jgi:hypothetical protein